MKTGFIESFFDDYFYRFYRVGDQMFNIRLLSQDTLTSEQKTYINPPDIIHNLFEGVAPVEIAFCIGE